ncbi:MAG TPA: vWA domain-containing protein [Armatimonadota bacterium]
MLYAYQNGNGAHPQRLKNYVAIVLDESGSMDAMRREAIDAFNEQADAIRTAAADQDTRVSLVKFNTVVPNPVYWNEPVGSLARLTARDYCPTGLTAMLDAVGLTIDRLKTMKDAGEDHVSFLVIVISDGYENNSKRFTYPQIAKRIGDLQKTDRWTFVYLGSNQDLSVISQEMGIHPDNVASFKATSEGMKEAGSVQAAATMNYVAERRAGMKSSKAFYKRDADVPPTPEDTGEGNFWNTRP